MRSRNFETETGAVRDACGHRDSNGMPNKPPSAAAALETGLGPHFSAAAAATTRALDREFEWNDGTASRLAVRQTHFSRYRRLVALLAAEKRVADTFDQAVDRRKVDRDFVLEAVRGPVVRPGHTQHFENRFVAERIASHGQSLSTIGVGRTLVKTPAR